MLYSDYLYCVESSQSKLIYWLSYAETETETIYQGVTNKINTVWPAGDAIAAAEMTGAFPSCLTFAEALVLEDRKTVSWREESLSQIIGT